MGRVFVGIDAGGLTSSSWLAFLEGTSFRLDQIKFTPQDTKIPWLSDGTAEAVAVDAPQGLPFHDASRRCADCKAKTPTGILPSTRTELRSGRRSRDGKKYPFITVVRLGCELFWTNQEHLYGLSGVTGKLIETYPRAVLRSWVDQKSIPSKRRFPREYVKFVIKLLSEKESAYSWQGTESIRVDHCDAMLCALAAQAHSERKAVYLGAPPAVDVKETVIREGYIVLPKEETSLFSRGQ